MLWMLRHGGETVQPDLLAQALGMSLDSALDALDYWVQGGAACRPGRRALPARRVRPRSQRTGLPPLPEPGRRRNSCQPAPQAAPAKAGHTASCRPDGEVRGIRFLMQEAENTLGKTLSPAMASTLLTICDDYGLPVVVVMLLHYAPKTWAAPARPTSTLWPGTGPPAEFSPWRPPNRSYGSWTSTSRPGPGAVRGGNAPALSL